MPDKLPDRDTLERLEKQFRDMAERQGQSEQTRRNAERLERQAREMYEKMSPQERQRLEEWAKQMARERAGDRAPPNQPGGDRPGGLDTPLAGADGKPGRGTPPWKNNPAATTKTESSRTAPVDARRAGEDARVLAEWFSPEAQKDAARAPGGPGVSGRVVEQQLRDAIKSADQAFEEQSVPARYRNVRQYFDRRLKELEASKPAPGTAAAPAGPAPAAQEPAKKP